LQRLARWLGARLARSDVDGEQTISGTADCGERPLVRQELHDCAAGIYQRHAVRAAVLDPVDGFITTTPIVARNGIVVFSVSV
jgi:hypothetical protein